MRYRSCYVRAEIFVQETWRLAMDKNAQQELIRLWCLLRKARGREAVAIRSQIAAKLAAQEEVERAA
jgi:hypothetical protein